MTRPRGAIWVLVPALCVTLLNADAPCGAQPTSPAPTAPTPAAPTLPGLRALDKVTDEIPRQFTKNQSLLLRADLSSPGPEEPGRKFDVLAGAYPQASGGGKVSIVKIEAGALIEGETYSFLRGVRPITVTKRIRTYSPATELAVWCSDTVHKKDFVFAIEGETKVILRAATQDPGPSHALPQGYCIRVREGPGGVVEFQDKAPMKIEDLKNAPDGSEEHRMYLFYQHVLEFARGAGLEPVGSRAQSTP